MKITKKTFGITATGQKVYLYTLKAGDLCLSLSSFGATWTSLFVPSRSGAKDDILLGYLSLDQYLNNKPFIGATPGRFGNRIGNAQFSLNGKTYTLYKNDGGHSLHGGRRGFDKYNWKTEAYEDRDGIFVRFRLESPDGDEGYPGTLKAEVCYGLTKSNELVAIYEAKLDAPSPVNLTNHSYFNLAGEGKGDILSHELKIYASSIVEADDDLIPTGKLVPVAGGPFDFSKPKPLSRDLAAAGKISKGAAGGYDHCFVVDGEPGKMRPCVEVYDPSSGRSMKISTTQPGVQLYTGNQLTGVPGKAGSVYGKHAGLCLETQHLPDSPNHADFPSCIYGPGKDYSEKSIFAFSW
ncbi:MAG: galactose mutarotase [Treponema sp.]|jgi:aldose 1-epimerase|nr:galactose mutarotase [Treponema sp.]